MEDALIEGQVGRLDHDAHAALADDALDAELAGQDLARRHESDVASLGFAEARSIHSHP